MSQTIPSLAEEELEPHVAAVPDLGELARASAAFRGIEGANVTPLRGQNRWVVQGRPAPAITFSIPSASCAPRTCVCA